MGEGRSGHRWVIGPGNSDKAEKYGIPSTVKNIITKTFSRDPRDRPTLQDVSDVLRLWERSLGGIEMELVGTDGVKVPKKEVVIVVSLSTEVEPATTSIDSL